MKSGGVWTHGDDDDASAWQGRSFLGRRSIGGGAGASLQHSSITGSQWIWYPEGNPARSAPVGTRYFRRVVRVDEQRVLESAVAAVCADNEFALWVNGTRVSEGGDFHVTVTTPITSLLRAGGIVIAVAVANIGDARIRPGGSASLI